MLCQEGCQLQLEIAGGKKKGGRKWSWNWIGPEESVELARYVYVSRPYDMFGQSVLGPNNSPCGNQLRREYPYSFLEVRLDQAVSLWGLRVRLAAFDAARSHERFRDRVMSPVTASLLLEPTTASPYEANPLGDPSNRPHYLAARYRGCRPPSPNGFQRRLHFPSSKSLSDVARLASLIPRQTRHPIDLSHLLS